MSKFDFVKAAKTKGDTSKQPGSAPGRPRAKRTDPEYTQITAYIRRTTHQSAKMKLLKEQLQNGGRGRDFSELVEDLVATWANEGRKSHV